MIRLLIADDHALVRDGVKRLLSLEDGITVVKEAANGAETMAAVQQGGLDLLLVDLNMPDIVGAELIMRIHKYAPTLPILVLSMHNEPQTVQLAIKAGASGYVVKDSEPEVLLTGVKQVAKGRKFIDPNLAEYILFSAFTPRENKSHQSLSNREFSVLCMIAQGKPLTQIANELCISSKTISTHKSRLMDKMGFNSEAELVRYAITHGLI